MKTTINHQMFLTETIDEDNKSQRTTTADLSHVCLDGIFSKGTEINAETAELCWCAPAVL